METLKVTSPYDGHFIAEIPLINYEKGEKMLDTAYKIFTNRSAWLPKHKRIKILEKTAQIMSKRKEELTKIAAEEGGKPYKDSKIEVLRAINGVKLAIEHIGQMKGSEIPMGMTPASEGRLAFTIREPIGVVFSISAFNHPLNLTVHQTVPAIAAGAPVIIKPASTTPLSAVNFVNILYEAGLPEAYCQVAVCKSSVAEQLVTDKRVNYMSFIGSSKIGWYLASELSSGTRYALEHGGVAPVIVEADADIEDAVPALIKGGFYHAGQVCVSVQKVFVHKDIIEEFTEKFVVQTKKLKTGNPLEKDTDVGPIIVKEELNRVENRVKDAAENGGKILCGGKRISEKLYEPTVILNPPENAKVSTEEIFGPVVCIYEYEDINDAIQRANSLPFAFQAAVYTKNINIALKCSRELRSSTVMINDHTAFRTDWMPFGGWDDSGIGIGGIPYSMHEMTREKLTVIKSKGF
ncbi:MAG: aldehyde dehydrogenase family protein [Bacteroidales bacterium]|nr:aldehyde dehydrogenase family protein [Bacteroidales bacterium]